MYINNFKTSELTNVFMKRFSSFMAIALVAVLALTFTSCVRDSDTDLAIDLNGTWKGTVDSDNGVFFVRIRFYQEGLRNYGEGYEYDLPEYGTFETYVTFKWYVRNGNIYIDYDDGTRVVIGDYSLRNGILTGRLTEGRSGWRLGYFSWTKISND